MGTSLAIDHMVVKLKETLKCDVLSDEIQLGAYSTDSSIYQIMPIAVVLPKHNSDVLACLEIAQKYQVPILCRGGGTSLAGQTVGKAIILDFTKYFSNILEYNPTEKTIKVQPGIILETLNNYVKKDRLTFAPDPATSNRASLGGMIANNSSGTKSILYGKTIDHLKSLEVLLSNGSQLELKSYTTEEFDQLALSPNRQGKIFKQFKTIVQRHKEGIKQQFPKTMRRVSGYPLDEFVYTDHWNLAKLFCGSEGTLGIILSATLHLEELPARSGVCMLHFEDRMKAIKAVEKLVQTGPSAIEMIDFKILDQSKANRLTRGYYEKCIIGHPKAVLITEYYANSELELKQKLNDLRAIQDSIMGLSKAPFYTDSSTIHAIWSLRKLGLGIAMSSYEPKKPIPFIEDSAIPLAHLATYISEIENFCLSLGVEIVIYAHASVGVLHVRPYLDMRKKEDIERFKKISAFAFSKVKEFGGAWSGEHGDGLARSYKLNEFFGDEIYQAFREIKSLFDPENLMNPGKIVDPPAPYEDLRYGINYQDPFFNTVYNYRKEHSFQHIVHNCSGVGACRKSESGTMCPSFKATRDELHSTRGRANVLRLAMSGQIASGNISSPEILNALDLCLSCKACKTECPSNVDMAKLKSEVLQHKYDSKGISLREWIICHSHKMSKYISGPLAGIINSILSSTWAKNLLDSFIGFSKNRTLPEYSTESFESWFRKSFHQIPSKNGQVILFADTYTNYHEPRIGRAAVKLLQSMGYEIILASVGCCQRPRISNGFLKKAKKDGQKLLTSLNQLSEADIPILVLEPGCASALKEDLKDLMDSNSEIDKLFPRIELIDEFISRRHEKGEIHGSFSSSFANIIIHGHCHQKSLYGTSGMHKIYSSIKGLDFEEPDTGCCGMAGAFGYEKEHYELSKKIAEQVLLPSIHKAKPDSVVVSNGFSCRHQLMDLSENPALHFVETIQFHEEVI